MEAHCIQINADHLNIPPPFCLWSVYLFSVRWVIDPNDGLPPAEGNSALPQRRFGLNGYLSVNVLGLPCSGEDPPSLPLHLAFSRDWWISMRAGNERFCTARAWGVTVVPLRSL